MSETWDEINNPDAVEIATLTDERDAAIAEARRLRDALESIADPFKHIGLHNLRSTAEEALATTPAAASKRRVAEQRVIEAARAHAQALSNGDDPYDALTAMDDALAALDAPGGGA